MIQPHWAIHPMTFAREALGFTPDPAQNRILASIGHRVIFNCSRQWGKSTITAVLALHRALSRPGSLILILGPCERQSALLLAKATAFAAYLGIPSRRSPVGKASAVFPNGSSLIALPGKEQYLRGFSAVSLLIVDEASRVPDELYSAMRPMLAVGDGDLWLLSTPLGRRGFFWRVWDTGEGEKWTRLRVPATDCPRISADFLARERKAQGEHRFRQDYLCEFVQPDDALFSEDLLRGLIVDDRPPLPSGISGGGKEWWR